MLETAILGVLSDGSLHGYELKKRITDVIGPWSSVSFGSLYPALSRLERAGHVVVDDAVAPAAPPMPSLGAEVAAFRARTRSRSGSPSPRARKVYSITPQGRSLFAALLRENLANASATTNEGDIGLMMLSYLDREVALESLRERLAKLDLLIEGQSSVPPHGNRLSIDLALDHLLAIRLADRAWLVSTIDRLERELNDGSRSNATGS